MMPWRPAAGFAVLVAALSTMPGTAEAQACLLNATEFYWSSLEVGQTGTSHGLVAAELGWQARPSWAVSGEVEAAHFTARDPERWTGRLRLFVGLPVGTVCLTASAEHDRFVDARVTTIPLGLLIGRNLGNPASSWHVVPFVEPRVAYRRASIPRWSAASAAVSVAGGAVLGRGPLFFELRYQKVLDYDEASSLRLGLGSRF